MTNVASPDSPLNNWHDWHKDGVPFPDLDAESLRHGMESAMAAQLDVLSAADYEQLGALPHELLVMLETSTGLLNAARATFFAKLAACSDESLTSLEAWIAENLSAHSTAVARTEGLFTAVSRALESCTAAADQESAPQVVEQQRALTKWHHQLTAAGCGLHGDERQDLETLNAKLAADLAAYNQVLQEATEAATVFIDDEAQLAGLDADLKSRFVAEAKSRGRQGFAIPLESPTRQSVMPYLESVETRKLVHEISTARGSAEPKVAELALRIMHTRAAIAELLGYPHAANQILDTRMAQEEPVVRTFLTDLLDRTKPALRQQLADLSQRFTDGKPLDAWDWDYYIAKAEASAAAGQSVEGADSPSGSGETTGTGSPDAREFFELDRLLHEGVFAAATALYGLTFDLIPDFKGYHEDVVAYDVKDADGSQRGVLYIDWYSRINKRGGAWAQTLRPQSRLTGDLPIVMMNLNLPKSDAGQPVLVSPDNVRTAFHEFGHVLHGLLSDVTYPSVAGLAVTRDFVEFPSQVNEIWAQDPALMDRFARHYRTDEPLPESLRDASTSGSPYDLAELFAAAVIDLAAHSLSPDEVAQVEDLDAFERQVLSDWGLTDLGLVPRYRLRYFAHIFAGGYAAGYYCYPWAEVLDADTAEWLLERGGLTLENGDLMRQVVLSRGDSVDPAAAMQKLLGRSTSSDAYFRRYGLDKTHSN